MKLHLWACVASACLLAGCSRANDPKPPQRETLNPIKTAVAQEEAIPDAIEIAAKVQPNPGNVVRIYPPISGRVLNVSVRPGDRVTRGQVVAEIQSSDVASARADYEKARADAERSTATLHRAETLYHHEVLAAKDYEDAQAASVSAKAELQRARERLTVLGTSVGSSSDRVPLHSPINGVVLDIGASAGELSKSLDNANAIVTIADLDSVWVLGDIFEQDLNYAKRGAVAELRFGSYPSQVWKGTVNAVSDSVDPTTHTLRVRIVLPNPNHLLKPEMLGTIRLSRGTRTEVVVPADAVLHDGDAVYVFVINGTHNEKRAVKVGQTSLPGKMAEITAGLKAGEQVVVSGAELLREEGGQ